MRPDSGREPAGEAQKVVGIWLRVSTEDQAQGESPEHHEKRARYYAEAKGWHVAKVYDLSGVSGKSVMEHPEAKRMLEDIKGGRITGLIFSKLARLARNTKELLEFADIFRDHGAALISLQESIDTGTPAGRLFYTVIAAMAAWEREEIAERVAVSVPIRAKLGKNTGGQAPFGYQWKDGKLMPEPKEAPVRRRMYELFVEHRRKLTVARILNEEGYRTRNGSKFTHTTVERLLRDPTAKGEHRANYTRSLGRGKSWELKSQDDWVIQEVEPIVSAELWDRANGILEQQRTHRKPATRRSVHLFAGVTRCTCGGAMYVPSNSPKYTCRGCRNKIPVVDLEAIFQEQLKEFFLSPERVAAYLEEGDRAIHEREELLAILAKERQRVQRDMDRTYQLYLDEKITSDGFGARYKPLEARLRQIDEQLPEARAELDLLRMHYLNSDQIVQDVQALCANWTQIPREEQRAIVESVTESIVVGTDEVDITLRYLPPLSGSENAQHSYQDEEPPHPDGGDDGPNRSSPPQGSQSAEIRQSERNDDMKCTQPCRCGHLDDAALACARAPRCALDYQSKISGPLFDRIDCHVEVAAVSPADLSLPQPAEGSREVALRVSVARERQAARYRAVPEDRRPRTNAEADGTLLEEIAAPDAEGRALLTQAAERMKLTARGYHRVLRVARTLADLEGAPDVRRLQIAEALSYRRVAPGRG